jgi:DNA-binding beta-propeller fold protein YncE
MADTVPTTDPSLTTGDAVPEGGTRRRKRVLLLLLLLGLLAFVVGLAIWYLLFRQPIPVPLPGIPVSQVPSYQTSIYGAASPTGVAVTSSGDRIYVTENGGDYSIKIFDGSGVIVGTMTFPPETGTDHVPVYVAIDPLTTEVYVSDRPTGTIHIFDKDGTWLRQYSPAEPLVGWQPLGLAFDEAGNLYVTELRGPGQRVLVFDRAGERIREIGISDELNFPNGVAVDQAGNVWVSDSNNGRMLVYDQAGDIVSRVGRGTADSKLGLPRGVAIDNQGRTFVVDSTGSSVLVYRPAKEGESVPEHVGTFGEVGVDDGQFEFPIGAAVDDRGRVYIADTANGRVQVWSY